MYRKGSYKKKYSNKRKSRSYYGYAKSAAKGIGTVAKLARNVNYLRSVINAEKKYLDTSGNGAVSTTATLTLLNGIAQGDTATTREGQSIKWTSLFYQYTCAINASAVQSFVRIIIFIDSQANGSAATAANILLTATDVLSPLSIGNAYRFNVILDRRVALSQAGNQGIISKVFRKLNIHTRYNSGNAGTIADIATNSIYLLLLSNEATNTPTVFWTTRLRFFDN